MKVSKVFVFVMCLVLSVFILSGCVGSKTSEVKVESGVINKDYVGVVSPVLVKDYKITEEAKEGMIKVTIKCGVEKEIPIGSGDKAGETDAKPKI